MLNSLLSILPFLSSPTKLDSFVGLSSTLPTTTNHLSSRSNVYSTTPCEKFHPNRHTLTKFLPQPPLLKSFVVRSPRRNRKGTHLAVDQLILGLLDDSHISDCLKEAGISASRVKSEVDKLRGKEGKKVKPASGDTNFQALKTYGRDLVEQAGILDPVIGRDEENRRVVRILSRITKNNPVLIGELGVGKTAVVEGLAQKIVRGDVPSNLLDVRLITLGMGALVAVAKYIGQFEERLKSVLKEVEDS